MRIDLHNHTHFCNHATGTMREYVIKAIELGIDVYGFSEHAPMNFDQHYRLPMNKIQAYENEVKNLKKEFENYIDILLGYEVDFMQHITMEEVILNAKVDYLIGSVHFLDGWGFDNPEFIGTYENSDIDKIWQDYFDCIEAMAKSSCFDIVGHLDLIKIFKYMPKKEIKQLAQNAIKAIKQANMVVEINPAGLRKPVNELYPSQALLEMCYESDIP
ncbi:MAG: histidinol phosphate phosphatase, partial [Deltaproteobacteria bacterium HGW-Deltaproteobacteria-24]